MTNWGLLEISDKDTENEKEPKNYRVRLFGIFYEKLLVPWFEMKGYQHLGKPTAYHKEVNRRGKSYDYLLEKGGKQYVVEAKCYPAYLEGRWKEANLELLGEPEDWGNESFQEFLKKDFLDKHVFYDTKGRLVHPTGKILVWWDYNKSELPHMKEKYDLDEIFSIKEIISELKKEHGEKYLKIVEKFRKWANDLFELLKE